MTPRVQTLCEIVQQLGAPYELYVPMMRRAMEAAHINDDRYNQLVAAILNHRPVGPSALSVLVERSAPQAFSRMRGEVKAIEM